MKKEFVKYETALALKELGFDEPCLGYYFGKDEKVYTSNEDVKPPFIPSLDSKVMFRAPLKQQAFRWFREKHQIHSTITSISQESWQWHITKPSESLGKLYEEDFYTYEEAEDACIDKLIEIVKNESKED